MTQRIVYLDDDGNLAIIIPSPEVLRSRTIEEVAVKDVPAGKPYKIISVEDIPEDRTFRNAWTVNEEDLTDGVGGESDQFPDTEEV